MTVQIEDGNRIELPAEWVRELGLAPRAEIERKGSELVIRATREQAPGITWHNLPFVRPGVAPPDGDDWELTGDDYLF